MIASRILPLLAAALLTTALAAGCGDDDFDDNGAPPTPTVARDATATPSATSVSSPSQFLYTVAAGDTLGSIAAALGDGSLTAAQLSELNEVEPGDIVVGMVIKVPLMLPGDLAMVPESAIEAALGVGGDAGAPVLLQPSLELRQGYLGKIALHSVQLADREPASEGYGYVMDYYLTDRAAMRAGAIDPEARFAGPAFTVAGGSLAANLEAGADDDLYRFEREGIPYAVVAAKAAELPAEQIAAMLSTAAER